VRVFLNAGFGRPLGADLLRLLRERGFAGIRQNVPNAAAAPELCRELAAAALQPILLLTTEPQGDLPGTPPTDIPALAAHVAQVAEGFGLFDGPHPAALEVGNEPDRTFEGRSALFAETVSRARDAIRKVSAKAHVIIGGITSPNRKRLDYLASAMTHGMPLDCIVGYHTYRPRAPESAAQGFKTRDNEFAHLRHIAGGRPIWCTEAGWHTAPFIERYGPGGIFKRTHHYTDVQVAEFVEREARLNARQGALGFVWYQLNDGQNEAEGLDRHGIRRLDGAWKPVAERLMTLGPVVTA
jgi:hypothetical protein